MVAQRWNIALGLGLCMLAGCGGGGGGGGQRTATPTERPATRIPSPTPTRLPVGQLGVSRVFPPIGSAAGGTPILIEGAGFSASGGVSVMFGDGAAANVIVLNDRQISCLNPSGEGGTVVPVVVSSSQGNGTLENGFRYGGGGSAAALNLELSGQPTVSFDSAIGTTTVLLDYLVRDSDGALLDESGLNVRLYVDDEQLGVGGRFSESVLDRDAEELDLNVFVLLVLDASFSLQQLNPPQFTQMLNAAQNLVDTGTQIWRNRGGQFDWNVVWFDELISRPDPGHVRSFRIANIPVPEAGNFTKLYAAISNAVELSASLAVDGVAAGARDRHVLVTFTDGLDNLSAFDNPEVQREGRLRNGDPYPRVGWRATALDDVLGEIAQHPLYPTNLTVHSIALGTRCADGSQSGPCFDETALGDIAQVGFGQLRASPRNVDSLFDLIQREFTTLQSSGAVMALNPGEYEFRLVAERTDHRASGELRFRFRVGADSAELVSF